MLAALCALAMLAAWQLRAGNAAAPTAATMTPCASCWE